MSFSSVAGDASARWYDVVDELSLPTAAHSVLRRALSWILSDNAKGGVAFQHDQPVIVAIDGSRLLSARPEDPSAHGPDAVIVVDSVPLDNPCRVGLVVTQRAYGGRPFLIRKWTIGEPSGNAFEVETRTPINDRHAFDDGREVVERAVSMLGWALAEGN